MYCQVDYKNKYPLQTSILQFQTDSTNYVTLSKQNNLNPLLLERYFVILLRGCLFLEEELVQSSHYIFWPSRKVIRNSEEQQRQGKVE